MTSKIIESLRDDMAALYEAGVIDNVTLQEFNTLCPAPARELSTDDKNTVNQRNNKQ